MEHIVYLTDIRVEIPIGFKTSLQFCSGSKEFQNHWSCFVSISLTCWVLDIKYKAFHKHGCWGIDSFRQMYYKIVAMESLHAPTHTQILSIHKKDNHRRLPKKRHICALLITSQRHVFKRIERTTCDG
jgi:hypothetical protein